MSALSKERIRTPMSRTSLHTPRPPRAVWLRPASGTRLLPYPFPPTVPHPTPHYKRCPKAHRLRLRSDQSLSPPVHVTGYGRFPDKKRHALSKGQCQVRAALTRRTTLALSGDAHEHGVKLLARAIVPRDSTVVAFGEAMPHGDGRKSTPPYLRMAGHFWWSRLPHTEIPSRLFHVLSEARGCRRVVADMERIGTGVDAFSRNRPGPSITSPLTVHSVIPDPDRESIPEGQGAHFSGRTSPSFPLVYFPVGTTGQSPRVWASRVGRPHPSPHP